MRRELKWESTLAHLQQQLGLVKGEASSCNAAATAQEQAKQLNAIRSSHKDTACLVTYLCAIMQQNICTT